MDAEQVPLGRPDVDGVALRHRSLALGVILAWLGTVCLAYAAWPPVAGTAAAQDFAIGFACLGAGAITAGTGRRLPPWLGADLPLVLGGVAACVMAASRPTPQGRLLFGFPMIAMVLYAGYFLDRRRAGVAIGAVVVGFCVATLAPEQRIGAFYVGVAATTIAMTGAAVVSLRASRDQALASLARQALVDPLTGALNRRGLEAEAPVVHAVAARVEQPTSVVVLDLDDFKAFNDEHGHAAGDDVLIGFTLEWQERLRSSDLIARVGGDEFVLVLPGSDLAATAALLARMRAASRIHWSAGSAAWLVGEGLAAVLREADDALYRDKRARRRHHGEHGATVEPSAGRRLPT